MGARRLWTVLLIAACESSSFGSKVEDAESAGATLAQDIEPVTGADQAEDGVFIPPFQHCQAARPEDAKEGAAPQVCTNVAISGCTEPGKAFADYASCDVVRTQRPFWPRPPAAEPRADDPRLQDAAFMRELGWMTEQVEACGCVCCHDSKVVGGQAGQWDIQRGPIWLDTLSDGGLALFAGLADSSVLGAYPREGNFGFDRTATGLPTTDTERLKAFLAAELERRDISEAEARAVPPFGGPIYENRVREPDACASSGSGIDPQLGVHFPGGPARYVYLLEAGSENPGVPPNLDKPDGTLWRLDVLASAAPLPPGFSYGQTPPGSFQMLPEQGAAPALERGTTYQLAVLKDVGVPLANCLFTFGDEVSAPAEPAKPAAVGGGQSAPGSACDLPGGDADGFGAACSADSACTCKASYCALMPGQTQGVCTVQGCKEDPGVCPAGYSCLDLASFSAGLPSICTN
jgi:hypothetical protein